MNPGLYLGLGQCGKREYFSWSQCKRPAIASQKYLPKIDKYTMKRMVNVLLKHKSCLQTKNSSW